MTKAKVCSREYKIMLKSSRFAGDETQLARSAGEFWAECSRKLGPVVLGLVGELKEVQARRTIRFFDTPGRELNNSLYIVRERAGLDGGGREITLKFRHPDRYVAADRGLRMTQASKAKCKFEEDIKPQFQQLYSFSSTMRVPAEQKLARVKHVGDLFPGFRTAFRGFREDDPLAVVGDFTARELVIGGGSLYLGKRYGVYASCVLVVWHDHRKDAGDPAVAEFSFKYGDKGEAYGGGTVRRAYDAFQSLQTTMPDWIDTDSKTKTAFVYG
ncbi:MAG: hypothetical protein K1X57_06375 [Gemmataceae bacterium]|nr:hypothetical protein [Gemmataceae bacterium]